MALTDGPCLSDEREGGEDGGLEGVGDEREEADEERQRLLLREVDREDEGENLEVRGQRSCER